MLKDMVGFFKDLITKIMSYYSNKYMIYQLHDYTYLRAWMPDSLLILVK